MDTREIIENLLTSTGREGIADLLQYMRANGFYSSPCSGSFHLAKEGGLAEHSLNVYDTMVKLNESLAAGIPDESVIIVSLLHDIGKCGQYNKPNYIPNMIKSRKKDEGMIRSEVKPFITNPDLLKIPHEIRSLQIITQFIELTEEEQFAIMYHADVAGDFKYIVADKQRPLQLLLFMADYWSARVTEV